MPRKESETSELLSKGESQFYSEFEVESRWKVCLWDASKNCQPRYPMWREKVCERCVQGFENGYCFDIAV